MRKVIWFTMISLDGFVTDRNNNINFHEPSEEVLHYVNALNANNSVMILDEQGYEIMKYWDNPPEKDLQTEVVKVYAEQWKHVRKIVVSDIHAIGSKINYVIWNELTVEQIDRLLDETTGDVIVGSKPLAANLLKLRRISDIQIVTVPIMLGAGVANYKDSGEVFLELIGHKIFENGWTYMHYRVKDER